MALRDTVYRLWGRKPGLPRLETVSDWADYAAFGAFGVLLLTVAGFGVALGVLGPSMSLAITAASILGGELLVAGAFLGLSVLLDRANSYVTYLKRREQVQEQMEEWPDPPQEHDVTPNSNPVKQAQQAEQAQQTQQAQSRTVPTRE